MRFTITALSFVLITSALSAPTLLSAESAQPSTAYPIGQTKGSNAKVAERLFNIDGKVEYFAGSNAWWLAHLSENADVDAALKQVAAVSCDITGYLSAALTISPDWL